jgi:hypothetical protein
MGPNTYSMFHKPGNTTQETIDAENACEGEIKQFVDLNVFKPVYRINPKNKHQKLLHTSMQITKKYKSTDGSYDKTKGRLIILGDKVDRNQYEANETSSSTGHNISLFEVINIGAYQRRHFFSADVPGAYLHSYMKHPHTARINKKYVPYFIKYRPQWMTFVQPDGTMLMETIKAVYGLPEAGERWWQVIKTVLLQLNYVQCVVDPCLFRKYVGPNDDIHVCLHVDDIFGSTTSLWLKVELISKLTVLFGEPRLYDGPIIGYLGLAISQPDERGGVHINQNIYLTKFLEKWNIQGTAVTPTTADIFNIDESSPLVDRSAYLSKLMGASWVKPTHPECCLAFSVLATRGQQPTEEDNVKLDRLCKYLNGVRHAGIYFKPTELAIVCYIDASFAVHNDCKSQTCIIIQMGPINAPLVIKSCIQKQNARSSTESELIGIDTGLNDIQCANQTLTFLYMQNKPVIVYQDNMSTIHICNTGLSKSGKARYMAIVAQYIKDLQERGIISINWCPNEYMSADIGTKHTAGQWFRWLRATLTNIEEGF